MPPMRPKPPERERGTDTSSSQHLTASASIPVPVNEDSYQDDKEVSGDTTGSDAEPSDSAQTVDSELECSESGDEEVVEIVDGEVDEAFMELSLPSATSVAQSCPSNPPSRKPSHAFVEYFCYFMVFFQLCYRLSD